MEVLTTSNDQLVYNAFSFAVAAMAISFVYYLVSRSRVSPAYRSAVTMSAMICGIAAYHYWRMFSNFSEKAPWNEGYRYADWLLTVPLLVVYFLVFKASVFLTHIGTFRGNNFLFCDFFS